MTQTSSAETVVLVHGLWMTGLELRWLGRQLQQCGFVVRYFRYRSWHGSLDRAAAELRAYVEQCGKRNVHLLGHSLGGIVISRMLEQEGLNGLGRIALLGSPQQGSSLAIAINRFRLGRFILGPIATEGLIHNRTAGLANKDLLVIAGTLSFGFARLFGVAVPNDGTVTAAETHVTGAHHIQVRASHMGMLFSGKTAALVCAYFQYRELR